MSEGDPRLDRARQLYWDLLLNLKSSAAFARLYADEQGRWIRRIGVVKGVAGSSTIAGWLIWKDYSVVWAMILAAAQILDSVTEYLPNRTRQRSASEWAAAAEILLIEAQVEYEALEHDHVDGAAALAAWERLAKRQRQGEQQHFPDGAPRDRRLREVALQEARGYFAKIYPSREQP